MFEFWENVAVKGKGVVHSQNKSKGGFISVCIIILLLCVLAIMVLTLTRVKESNWDKDISNVVGFDTDKKFVFVEWNYGLNLNTSVPIGTARVMFPRKVIFF